MSTKQHTLISIGFLGGQTVFIDVPEEEARRRYNAAHADADDPDPASSCGVRTFIVSDHFGVYDIEAPDPRVPE